LPKTSRDNLLIQARRFRWAIQFPRFRLIPVVPSDFTFLRIRLPALARLRERSPAWITARLGTWTAGRLVARRIAFRFMTKDGILEITGFIEAQLSAGPWKAVVKDIAKALGTIPCWKDNWRSTVACVDDRDAEACVCLIK
jgi:hypothetical protein